jgi:hypothetical protein
MPMQGVLPGRHPDDLLSRAVAQQTIVVFQSRGAKGEGSAPLPRRVSRALVPTKILISRTPSLPVVLTESERGTSEAEWKDPEDASSNRLHQGVLS